MEDEKKIVDDNIDVLKQGRELIQNISTNTYRNAFPGMKNGTIGAHFRHCLEVYQCFINGLDEACVDYDNRPRSEDLENDPYMAIATIDRIIRDLELMCSSTGGSSLKIICWNNDNTREMNFDTSFGRELMYLFSHSIHHYALIKMILLHHGIPVDDRFGVAPSTLVHWENTKPAEFK